MKCAIVTLLMNGDFYLPGALVTGYSFKLLSKSRTLEQVSRSLEQVSRSLEQVSRSLENPNLKIDLVCMVTPDVSPNARQQLKVIYDLVVEVPYLRYKTNSLGTRYEETYGHLKDSYYTKWNCLSLDQYEKIILLDIDIVVIKPITHLFTYSAPAGIFTTSASSKFPRFDKKKSKGHFDPYPIAENIPIDPRWIDQAFYKSGSVASANFILLAPSKTDFDKYKSYMTSESSKPGGYGYSTCVSGHDEQSITDFYAYGLKQTWTLLPTYYNWVCWNPSSLIGPDHRYHTPYTLHFLHSPKPWDPKVKLDYLDILAWTDCYQLMIKDNPELVPLSHLVGVKTSPVCWFCDLLNRSQMFIPKNIEHTFYQCDPPMTINCPIMNKPIVI